MIIGALGDIHGAFDTVQSIMRRHPDVPLWVSVGDVASNDGDYFEPAAPLYFIKGNNEDFDVLADSAGRASAGAADAALPAERRRRTWWGRGGSPRSAAPSRRAGTTRRRPTLPPSKGRKPSAASLKLGKSRDDKRRHFVRDEVAACKAALKIDVLLTHEAPRPFYPAGKRIDAGKTVLNDVLAAMRPRLHLFGHHHEFSDSIRQGVRSIGLDVVTNSYLLIDAETFKTERCDTQ